MSKVSTRVVLNRSRVGAIRLALAQGVFDVAVEIVDTARPPSDVGKETPGELFEEIGERRVPLVRSGGAVAWVDGKKVAGMSLSGHQPSKPRALKLLRPGITGIAGFGFPGRFTEFGTIKESPRPFLTPAGMEVASRGPAIMAAAVRRHSL